MSATATEAKDYLKNELESDKFIALSDSDLNKYLTISKRQIEREYKDLDFTNIQR